MTPATWPSSMHRTWAAPGTDLQAPAAVAVVIPTILRPSLQQAIASVFAQDFAGRVQILLGIDIPAGLPAMMLDAIGSAVPAHCTLQALYPGYSTSVRHGGWCAAGDGGALRSILSYLANAPLIAYLDDDNWWDPRHLATLTRAIEAVDWAYTLRRFVHPHTSRPVCVDLWESVGPGHGIYRDTFGGFVDPNCLMIRRATCADALPLWTRPLPGDATGLSADRQVFEALRHRPHAGTGEATTFYRMNPADGLHPLRLQMMGDAYDQAGAAGA